MLLLSGLNPDPSFDELPKSVLEKDPNTGNEDGDARNFTNIIIHTTLLQNITRITHI